MPDSTSCKFTVNDEGGGADNRDFLFNTIQQGDSYNVTITNDGMGPYGVSLSTSKPNANIPSSDARVKATGHLSLLFDQGTGSNNVVIQFTGTLNTTHPTSVNNVVVATFD
jgi:hypothetical protein